jgi:hypothetical protein
LAEGIIQDGMYINSHLDLSIPVSRMHWDPSAGYMRDLFDCFTGSRPQNQCKW